MRFSRRNVGRLLLPVLAFALVATPTRPVMADPVTLPNGLTLELIGVTTGPSIDRAWWKPDGSPLQAPPYEQASYTPRTQPTDRTYELAVRVTGLTGERIEQSIDRVGKYYVSGGGRPFAGGEEVRDVFVFTVTVPAAEEAATVEFEVGANEWKTLHTFNGPGAYGEGPTRITVKAPDHPRSERPGQPPPFFYVRAMRGRTALRLVAIGADGKQHLSTGGQWWGRDEQTVPAVFPGLAQEQVREYRLQSLPYHPVKFEGVKLRPGAEAQAAAVRWRAERLRRMEQRFAADPEAARRAAEALLVLRGKTALGDTDAWARAVRDLAEAGPPAMPLVVAEMNRTARPYVRSSMAIVLRALGDPRAGPGLATALATTSFAPNDYGGSQIKDEKLRRYIARAARYDAGDMGLSFGRPVNEITETLVVLSGGHSEGDQHRMKNDRRLYEEAAARWSQWWAQNQPALTAGLPLFRGAFDARGEPVDLPASLNDLERLLDAEPDAAKERLAGEWTRLHVAALHNRLFEATLLTANGADANARCYGWTPLHLGAAAGAQDVVARFLEKKLDPNAKTPGGQTVLHAALGLGVSPAYGVLMLQPDVVTVKALLAAGADVNATDAEGATPLHGAAAFDDKGVVEALLAGGADVKAADSRGRTPLHRAAECGAAEVADALLNAGADVNALDAQGRAPIHVAGYSIHYRDFNSPLIPMLLARGAKVSLVATVSLGTVEQVEARLKEDPSKVNEPAPKTESDDPVTPLQMAISRGEAALVKLLLEHGADVNAMRHGQTALTSAVHNGRKDLVEMLLAAGADLEKFGLGQGSPLYWAASHKNLELAKLLLDRGADPNADGGGPLRAAASVQLNKPEDAAVAVLELLLSRGAKVAGDPAKDRSPPIFWAQPKVAEVLLKHGAKLDAFNEQGETPLHTAAALRHDGTIKVLLAHKADVNVRGKSGQTPLHTAFKIVPSPQVVEVLLAAGADPNAADDQGRTPLHSAAEKANADVVSQLLDAKAEPNARDDSGATPLHLAAKLKRKDTVELLLKRGAGPLAKDKGGKTPAEWAEDEEVKGMLKGKGA